MDHLTEDMDHRVGVQVATALAARLDANAPVAGIALTATRAWKVHYRGPETEHAAMAAVVDATWPLGYKAGAELGHVCAASVFQQKVMDQLAALSRQAKTDPAARRLLWTVAAATTSTVNHVGLPDRGPTLDDYDIAWADYGDDSPVGRLAAAARVGWAHGYHNGSTDAAEALTAYVDSEVGTRLGPAALRYIRIAGERADKWLYGLKVEAWRSVEPWGRIRQVHRGFQPLTVVQPGQAPRAPQQQPGTRANTPRRVL